MARQHKPLNNPEASSVRLKNQGKERVLGWIRPFSSQRRSGPKIKDSWDYRTLKIPGKKSSRQFTVKNDAVALDLKSQRFFQKDGVAWVASVRDLGESNEEKSTKAKGKKARPAEFAGEARVGESPWQSFSKPHYEHLRKSKSPFWPKYGKYFWLYLTLISRRQTTWHIQGTKTWKQSGTSVYRTLCIGQNSSEKQNETSYCGKEWRKLQRLHTWPTWTQLESIRGPSIARSLNARAKLFSITRRWSLTRPGLRSCHKPSRLTAGCHLITLTTSRTRCQRCSQRSGNCHTSRTSQSSVK